MGNAMDNYGDEFQKKSKYKRGQLPRHYLDWDNKPPTYKKYPNAMDFIELPKPNFDDKIQFWRIIINRTIISARHILRSIYLMISHRILD